MNPETNQRTNQKPKILVVVGPTSSGKSDLAVSLAEKHAGSVVSADSRQIYQHLDIATGKVTEDEQRGIPHFLLSFQDPARDRGYTVAEYQKDAHEAIQNILKNGRLPIVCGGTGQYIQAIVDDFAYPEVPPNKKLREKLQEKTNRELFEMVKDQDPERAKTIDPHNARRTIRALEIIDALGSVPRPQTSHSPYNAFQIGLSVPRDILKERIKRRTQKRFDAGILEEAEDLYANNLSLTRMRNLGMEYRLLADYLEKKLSKEELFTKIETANYQYAIRQNKWFENDSRIHWYPYDAKDKIMKDTDAFLNNKNA